MELNEKLQELRKAKGMTQEELAKALYVSRTAISKWESGRGTPGLESLKQISAFFSVSIDDLLSAENVLTLAERESEAARRNQIDLCLGLSDAGALLPAVLPLYPNAVGETVYAVNLLAYANTRNRLVCIALFLLLILTGAAEITLACLKNRRGRRALTVLSFLLGIVSVLFMIAARIGYAAAVMFLLLVLKGILLVYRGK
ncbi:helix-turn-helix transcriptional regulator [Gemmiger sp.]